MKNNGKVQIQLKLAERVTRTGGLELRNSGWNDCVVGKYRMVKEIIANIHIYN